MSQHHGKEIDDILQSARTVLEAPLLLYYRIHDNLVVKKELTTADKIKRIHLGKTK